MLKELVDFADELIAAKEIGQEFMFQTIIDYGKKLGDFPKNEMTETNKVPGCQSLVYVIAEQRDKKIFYKGFADSQFVSGQLYILIKSMSDNTPDEILSESKELVEDFIESTRIISDLSPTRANAFGSMYDKMVSQALKVIN